MKISRPRITQACELGSFKKTLTVLVKLPVTCLLEALFLWTMWVSHWSSDLMFLGQEIQSLPKLPKSSGAGLEKKCLIFPAEISSGAVDSDKLNSPILLSPQHTKWNCIESLCMSLISEWMTCLTSVVCRFVPKWGTERKMKVDRWYFQNDMYSNKHH